MKKFTLENVNIVVKAAPQSNGYVAYQNSITIEDPLKDFEKSEDALYSVHIYEGLSSIYYEYMNEFLTENSISKLEYSIELLESLKSLIEGRLTKLISEKEDLSTIENIRDELDCTNLHINAIKEFINGEYQNKTNNQKKMKKFTLENVNIEIKAAPQSSGYVASQNSITIEDPLKDFEKSEDAIYSVHIYEGMSSIYYEYMNEFLTENNISKLEYSIELLESLKSLIKGKLTKLISEKEDLSTIENIKEELDCTNLHINTIKEFINDEYQNKIKSILNIIK